MHLLTPVLAEEQLAFTAWVGSLAREHRVVLIRVARSEGLVQEEALDAVQDAFITFMQKPDWRNIRRDGPDAIRLLTTVVRNTSRNARRKHHRKDLAIDAVQRHDLIDKARRELESVLIEAEEHIRLTGCIATLENLQQQVVKGRLFEGVSGLAVAAELGLAPAHVAVILHRAKDALRSCIQHSQQARG